MILSPETKVKSLVKDLRKELKTKIASDVFDAFENSIARFWLTYKCASRVKSIRYVYIPSTKSLIPFKGTPSPQTSFCLFFELKQNTRVLDDLLKNYPQDNESIEAALDNFWIEGHDDVFVRYQGKFEDDLDDALEEPLEAFLDKVLEEISSL